MSGIFYFWRSHTATVSGATTREEQCFSCGMDFTYQVFRQAPGGGHSPLFLFGGNASATARDRANANLNRKLREAVEPVACRACGLYAPDMAKELNRRFRNSFDVNAYAAERVRVPASEAWRAAIAEDDVPAYQHFIETWPNAPLWVSAAQDRIKEINRPKLVKIFYRLLPKLARIVWAIIVLIFAIFVVMTIIERR